MRPRSALTLVAVVLTLATVPVTVALSAEGGEWKLVLFAVALGLPGALGATLHPYNAAAWLLLAVGLVFGLLGVAAQWLDAGHASPWATWLVDRSGAIVVPLTLLAILLLPDGRLPSPRWRPVTAVVIAAQLVVIFGWSTVSATSGVPNPVGVLPAGWADPIDAAGSWVLQLPFLLAIAAVVVRLRRQPDRARLAGVLGGAAGFAVLAVAGHVLWPASADASDVLGAMVLGTGTAVTLLHRPDPVPAERAVPPEVAGLSDREQQVLELVADGLTNRQIADRLFISPVTARNHVSNILTKLGVENRTQAATLLAGGRDRRT